MQPSAPACATCSLKDLCLPAGLAPDEVARLDEANLACQTVLKGQTLFTAGDRFEAVFAVKAGSFKTCTHSTNGGEHVTHFHMAGELLGLTGIAHGLFTCDAVALEDSQVCVIDFDRLEALARACPALQRGLHCCMSEALIRDHTMLTLLAQAGADERVASFLLDLALRHQRLGLSPDDFTLRMSREEIANLLGLRIETVSRCLTRLQAEGIVEVHGRRVHVLSPAGLRKLSPLPSTRCAPASPEPGCS